MFTIMAEDRRERPGPDGPEDVTADGVTIIPIAGCVLGYESPELILHKMEVELAGAGFSAPLPVRYSNHGFVAGRAWIRDHPLTGGMLRTVVITLWQAPDDVAWKANVPEVSWQEILQQRCTCNRCFTDAMQHAWLENPHGTDRKGS